MLIKSVRINRMKTMNLLRTISFFASGYMSGGKLAKKFSTLLFLIFVTGELAKGIGQPAGIGNTEQNVVWLRADQGTSSTTDLLPVNEWQDISGNSLHAQQTEGSLQPLFIANAINGMPAIWFDGSDDFLSIADVDALDNTHGVTLFAVTRPENPDGQPRGIISKRTSSGNEEAYYLFVYDNNRIYFNAEGNRINSSNNLVTDQPQVFSTVFDGSLSNPRSRIFHNGVQSGSGNGPTSIGNYTSDLHIGILNPDYGRGFRGDIAEIIVYRSSLNAAQRSIIEAYLGNRYNISLGNANFSSTTHKYDFTGIGHSNGALHSQSQRMGSGIWIEEANNSLDETDEFVFVAHDNTVHGFTDSQLPEITDVTLDKRWSREYYIERVQGGIKDDGITDVKIGFDFDESGLTADDTRLYLLLYRASELDDYSYVPGAFSMVDENTVVFDVANDLFQSGYYTIVRTDLETLSYYSLNDGNWNDLNNWSLNPSIYVAASKLPGAFDRVVIQENKTITVTSNNLNVGTLEVNDGRLDFGTTSGHVFSTIKGLSSGIIRLAADNFPEGDVSGFSHPDNGGTVEYYGSGTELNTQRIFRNMRVNLQTSGSQIFLLSSYTLHGNLEIETGALVMGNESISADQELTIKGNLLVKSNGRIQTGTANARHQINLYGDLENKGNIEFTNRFAANYNNEATDGITDINFLSPIKDQKVTLNGPAKFYRLVIDKATTTYSVKISAEEPGFFELLGFATQGHGSESQLSSNTNALGLISGTLRIGQNITIEQLNGSGNYNISKNAVLWVDGGTVTKPSGTAIVVYGKVKISSGVLNADINSGITTRENGTFESSGGTANLRQFRTSVYGEQHQGGYIQSGGVVNLVAGNIQDSYYRFNLTYPGNVFHMTGGVLYIQQSGNKGGIFINSDPENQNITGGTVICQISNNSDFIITSRAPFWNLDFRKQVANSNSFILDEGVDVGGTNEYLAGQPLRVLRNLTIRGTESGYQGVDFYAVTDAANVNDVFIGGSFRIESGSQYWIAADGDRTKDYNGMARLPTIMNTTWFNQTAATPSVSELYWGNPGDIFDYGSGNSDNANMAELGHVVINRNSGYELRLVSPGPGSGMRSNAALTVDVNGDLVVESGTLDQGRLTIRTWGSITNNDRLGTWFAAGPYPTDNGTPNTAQIRFRESEDRAPVINSNSDAIFGNIRFNVNINAPFVLANDMYFERMEFMRGIIYLGKYNLKVDDLWNLNNENNNHTNFFIDGAQNSSYLRVANTGRAANQQIMIITDGTASAAGLSLKVNRNTSDNLGNDVRHNISVITFPIGFSTDDFSTELTNTYYRPAQIKVKDFSDDGYLTIRPVSGVLQTTDHTGGEILQHYWRVTQSDFTDLPALAYRFYYRNQSVANVADLPAGAANQASYVPGKVMDQGTYQRSFESDDPAEMDVNGVFPNATDPNTQVIVFNGDNVGDADDDLFGFSTDAPGIPAEDSRFTTGQHQRFIGAPTVYYTRLASGSSWYNRYWDDGNNWSLVPHDGADNNSARPAANAWPGMGDIAVIGYGGPDAWLYDKHSINIRNGRTVNVAEIRFDNPRSNSNRLVLVRNSSLTFGQMTGTGGTFMQKYYVGDVQSISGDFGDFYNKNTFTYSYYLDNNGTYNITPPTHTFPNLRVEGGNNSRIAIFQKNIVVNNIFTVDGNTTLRTNNGPAGDIEVKGELRIGGYLGGNFEFNNGAARNVTVGSLRLRTGSTTGNSNITVLNNVPNGIEHNLTVNGDIIQDNTGNTTLFSGNGVNNNNVILNLSGEGQHSYTRSAGNTPVFYRIVMNKGNTRDNSFTFQNDFELNGRVNNPLKPLALELINGSLIIGDPDIDLVLSDSGGNFVIPSRAALVMQTGTASLTGADTGILLDGLLRLEGDANVSLDGGSGLNNFIEYSASNQAAIQIMGGLLTVGSQIRRSTTTTEGILKYTQTSGQVIVGKNSAPTGNRGVFEVINNGSLFHMTGGSLTIVRAQNSATEATLLLEPANSNVGNSSIIMGNEESPEGQILTLKSSVDLGNLTVSGNNTKALLKDRSLVVKGDITIQPDCSFDGAGSFNLTVNRHFENSGIDEINVDTLFLRGSSAFPAAATQHISGNINVKNLTVAPATAAILQNASILTVTGNLNISNGQLEDGGNLITVMGDIINESTHVSTNSLAGGIRLAGSAVQRLYGQGQYGRLDIDNPFGVILHNDMALQNDLSMSNGILQLRYHKLTLGQQVKIINTGMDEFGPNKMIAVDGSDFLKGIEKTLPVIAQVTPSNPYDIADPAYSWRFFIPIGTDNGSERKYTPVELAVAGSNSAGTINLFPVNRRHMTIDPLPGRVLQYFWTIKSDNIAAVSALLRMHYEQNDAQVDPDDETSYLAARLEGDNWAKFQEMDPIDPGFVEIVDESANIINFSFANTGTLNGDYTAGIGDDIPDNVPVFFTNASGNWTDPLIWDRVDGGMIPENGPSGQIVRIMPGHSVILDQNYRQAYRTEILGSGRLDVNTTINHILGQVSGTGTLALQTGSVPAGNYDNFILAGTGTFEFGGNNSYGLPSRFQQYNNLTLAGTGIKIMPDLNIWINGNLSMIDNSLLLSSKNLQLRGNLTKTENARFQPSGYTIFAGSNVQTISGDFTGSNAFSDFRVSNSQGIDAHGNLEVNNTLYLDNGVVRMQGIDAFRHNGTYNPSSFNNLHSSWISGKLERKLSHISNDNLFMAGNNSKPRFVNLDNVSHISGSKYWSVNYYDQNPVYDGMDPEIKEERLKTLSEVEYWRIVGPLSGKARVRLHYGPQSLVDENPEYQSTTVVAEWDSSKWVSREGSATPLSEGFGYVAASVVSSFSTKYFTIGSTSEFNPLPIELISFTGNMENDDVMLKWVTASEINNHYFTIESSENGVDFESVAIIASQAEFGNSNRPLTYSALDNQPFDGMNYYRLKQTDYDGKFEYSQVIAISFSMQNRVNFNLFPNPNKGNRFNISLNQLQPFEMVSLLINDITGRTHQNIKLQAGQSGSIITYIIPPYRLPKGIYMIIISGNSGKFIHKMIVE